jgi:methionyl-tRNA formyltransferase
MRIAILCNDHLGLAALHQLLPSGLLVAAASGNHSSEPALVMKGLCNAAKVPFRVFLKKDFETELMQWLDIYKPDVVFVKTFPRLIPAAALAVPTHGFINFHYAPLPGFRGANPIFWMIRNREKEGGVTVHKMDSGYDSGDILLSQPVPLTPDKNNGFYCTQLSWAGAQLTMKLLERLQTGKLIPVPQDESKAKWYGRQTVQDMTIRWKEMDAASVKALVKACNPALKGAITGCKGWIFGITEAEIAAGWKGAPAAPGTIVTMDPEKETLVACANNTYLRLEVFYCREGFYPGYKLRMFGMEVKSVLG